jgi:hypothetical protein
MTAPLDLIQLPDIGTRYPGQLSGGQPARGTGQGLCGMKSRKPLSWPGAGVAKDPQPTVCSVEISVCLSWVKQIDEPGLGSPQTCLDGQDGVSRTSPGG